MKNLANTEKGRTGRHSHHGACWMKVALVAVLCACNLLTVQAAWASPDANTTREQRIAEVQARLNLTNEQLAQIRPVLQDAAEAQRAVLQKYGIDLEAEAGSRRKVGMREGRKLRGDLQKVQADTQRRLEGILTQQQLKEFEKIQRERAEDLRKRIR